MLRRPSAPRKRAFLGKIFKGITRALGLGEKKAPSVTVDMSAMTKMADAEAARAAAEGTRIAQGRAAEERAAQRSRLASVLAQDEAEISPEDLKRKKASIL